MNFHAFKEWAAVCRALASGRQTLILRKGGIAETGGAFRPEHETFLLYPTYFHEQQSDGLKTEAKPELEWAEAERPVAGTVTFRHVVTTTDVIPLRTLDAALRLDPFHLWTRESVTRRFHYRSPGLFALIARTFILPRAVSRPEDPSYAGCKSWVTLTAPVPTDRVVPVLGDEIFQRIAEEIRAAVS